MANTFQAVGRRKEAIARVRLVPGTGQRTINGKPIDVFFPRKTLITDIIRPLEVTSTGDRYDVVANVNGGGVTGQASFVLSGCQEYRACRAERVPFPSKAYSFPSPPRRKVKVWIIPSSMKTT